METTVFHSQSGEAWIGRQQAFAMIAHKCSEHQAQCLKHLRDGRIFESYKLSWDDFCETQLGLNRTTANRIIERYEEFGAAYFKLAALAKLPAEVFRRIADSVDGDTIEIDGQPIPIDEAHAPQIRAHIQSLRVALRAEKQRTDPSLQELRSRLNNLITETSRRVSITMPTVHQPYLLEIADDAARKWAKIAKDLRRIMSPGEEAA